MRHAAAPAMLLGLLAVGLTGLLATGGGARAEYYCSPGFEPISGGRCVATQSRSEVDLYLNEPVYDEARPPVGHFHHARYVHHARHHRHHGLRASF